MNSLCTHHGFVTPGLFLTWYQNPADFNHRILLAVRSSIWYVMTSNLDSDTDHSDRVFVVSLCHRVAHTSRTAGGDPVLIATEDVSYPKRPRRLWSPVGLSSSGLFSGVKWPERDVSQYPLSSHEVENEWNSTSVPPYMLSCHGRDSLTLFRVPGYYL